MKTESAKYIRHYTFFILHIEPEAVRVDSRRLDENGKTQEMAAETRGFEFQINSHTEGDQANPSVTALSDGGFVVTWESDGQDGSGLGVYGQRYDATGTARGAEFRIATTAADDQQNPSVTGLSNGGFVVA